MHIISCQALTKRREHRTIAYTTTRFYGFINAKIKKEPENLELYMCSKKRTIPHFSAASSKFHGKRRILRRGVKTRGVLLALLMIANKNELKALISKPIGLILTLFTFKYN